LLQHPTIDRLRELGLEGMAKSLRELSANPESKALDHMEWLGILLEHEMTLRQQKRFEASLSPRSTPRMAYAEAEKAPTTRETYAQSATERPRRAGGVPLTKP
jgi:hypothetical protein